MAASFVVIMVAMHYLIGIDEVGRGPLAGPVAVGAVMVPADFDWSVLEGVRDSKKLSEKKREEFFARAVELQESQTLRFAVSTSSAAYIDRYGIVPAIKRALAEALQSLTNDEVKPHRCTVLLDGSLRAPEEFVHQETIIGGDDIEPVIALASVMAKVSRDSIMRRLAPRYPQYGFEEHKGYGTAAHRDIIGKVGLCKVHRATFCRNFLLEAGS